MIRTFDTTASPRPWTRAVAHFEFVIHPFTLPPPLGRERGPLREFPDPEGVRRQPPALHRLYLLQGLSADGSRLGGGRQAAAHPRQGRQERAGLHEQYDRREWRPRCGWVLINVKV